MFKCKWLLLPFFLLFCASSVFSSECRVKINTLKTTDVRIDFHHGVRHHIGVYSDGSIIITDLDGREMGKQVVTINGTVLGTSYDISFRRGYFRHKYSWGEVLSYPTKQSVKFY